MAYFLVCQINERERQAPPGTPHRHELGAPEDLEPARDRRLRELERRVLDRDVPLD